MSVLTIYYHNFSSPLGETELKERLRLLPDRMAKKVLRYRKAEDRHRSLYGKLLLLRGLKDLGYDYDLDSLSYNSMLKPFFEGSTLNFNISHAHQVVLCGFIENTSIGIDVEKIRPIVLDDYEFIFDTATFSRLRQASNREAAFFEAWTILEAVLKAQGNGLTEDAKKIKYQNGVAKFKGEEWFVKQIPHLDMQHIIHVATGKEVEKMRVIKVL